MDLRQSGSIKLYIAMFYTQKSRQLTQTTSSTGGLSRVSRVSRKLTDSIKRESSNEFATPANKSPQSIKPVTKLSIRIKQKRVDNPEQAERSPRLRMNPTKYRINIISKMSSQHHDFIQAYGVSTFKGHKNATNPHFIGVNLGKVKAFTLCESFDGQLAAKTIKQEFPIQLVDLYIQGQHTAQSLLYQTFNQVQERVMQNQSSIGDNSGSTLMSVVIDKDMIRVANAGCSQAICETKKGSILKLSQPHTTLNKSEIQRIINNGGSIYQTVVNVPYQDELQIKGPMRISPSGLMYTRCLGKTLDYQKQLKELTKVSAHEKLLNITWRPQIRYVKTEEVVWLGLFCNNIITNCSIDYIKSVVHGEIKCKSKNYTEHHISMAISKKIIDKLVNDGVNGAMSATIVILNPLGGEKQAQKPVYIAHKNQSRLTNEKAKDVNSRKLTYLGNRTSFVKSISLSHGSTSKSKTVIQIPQSNTGVKNLKKDVSFQSFCDFN